VRPERKSVKLMRDLIRLFAPNASDIVVDLFAGTMSTVVAAIHEDRPVYACEKDKHCF
jgi:DNA modification methylase